VLVTNASFRKFLSNDESSDELVRDAHYLTEFLLEHSIVLAVKIKALLICHPKYDRKSIKNVNIAFGKIVMNAVNSRSYDLAVSLGDAKEYWVYSISASVLKKEIGKYEHRINLTTWKEN